VSAWKIGCTSPAARLQLSRRLLTRAAKGQTLCAAARQWMLGKRAARAARDRHWRLAKLCFTAREYPGRRSSSSRGKPGYNSGNGDVG